VQRWSPNRAFFNAYGPTEATVCATIARCQDDPRPPSIGRPIANTQVYLLDTYRQPVPVGIPGELWIGGAGVARGYHNRPDLTSDRFVPDPFRPGGRLYRTGDLGRWRADGTIEFLGRTDDQVKLHGHRIEPAEIDVALRSHPLVRNAFTTLRHDDPGDPRLVSYVMLAENSTSSTTGSPGGLREFLRGVLPRHMVPARVVPIASFPITANGKIDRSALPPPSNDRLEEGAAFVAPRTRDEELVASVWTDVLGVAPIGVNDNFFALGGHSLLAAQLVARLEQALDIKLSIHILFNAPTVALLVRAIQTAPRPTLHNRPSTEPTTTQGTHDRSLVAAPAQEHRLPVFNGLLADVGTEPAWVFYRLTGTLQPSVLQQSLNTLLRRHDALRMTFPASHCTARAEISDPKTASWPLNEVYLPAKQVAADPKALPALLERFSAATFDLKRGPLVNGLLTRLSATTWILGLSVAHAVFDGVSLSVLVRELSETYNQLLQGRQPALPELPYDFLDYARAHHAFLDSTAGQAHLDHWTKQFDDLGLYPPELRLEPTPGLDPRKTGETASITRMLSDSLILNVQQRICAQHDATAYMAFLTALLIALRDHSTDDRVGIAIVDSGRQWPSAQQLIGCFVHGMQICCNLPRGIQLLELLPAVRHQTLAALEHSVPLWYVTRKHTRSRDDLTRRHRTPRLQFVFEAADVPIPSLTSVQAEHHIHKHHLGHFQEPLIRLSIAPRNGRWHATCEFVKGAFAPSAVSSLLARILLLLEQAVQGTRRIE
jgi:acyl carrier protein